MLSCIIQSPLTFLVTFPATTYGNSSPSRLTLLLISCFPDYPASCSSPNCPSLLHSSRPGSYVASSGKTSFPFSFFRRINCSMLYGFSVGFTKIFHLVPCYTVYAHALYPLLGQSSEAETTLPSCW